MNLIAIQIIIATHQVIFLTITKIAFGNSKNKDNNIKENNNVPPNKYKMTNTNSRVKHKNYEKLC